MKAIQVISPGKIKIIELPVPKNLGDQEVLIKVHKAGICGSDIHIFHGTSSVATYPRVIGHEIAGEVIRTGKRVIKCELGDHVVMDPVISCGECYPCSIGRSNVCAGLKVRGVHVDGGYQEYMVLAQTGVNKISSTVSWEKAVMVEPFTVAAQVVSRGEILPGDTVFIMGAGPVGLSILQVVKNIGAKCIISDLMEARLALAQEMGADITVNISFSDIRPHITKETAGLGPSVIIDTVCTSRSFEEAIQLAPPAGRIVLLGFVDQPSQIAQFYITSRELDIKGSRLHHNKFPQVIKWFEAKNGPDPTRLISHRFHFTEIEKAINQIEANPIDTIKVILDFD